MTATDPRPVRQAPNGFEYRLGGNSVRLVDVRPRLDPDDRLEDFPTTGVPDELFEKIMLRRDENQAFVLQLDEASARLYAQKAMDDCDVNPYALLLSLGYEQLDWLVRDARVWAKIVATDLEHGAWGVEER